MAREQSYNAGDFSAVQKMIIENYDHFVTDTTDGDVYVFDKINWNQRTQSRKRYFDSKT